MTAWITAAGWLGAGLVLAAYGLLSARRLDGNSPTFQMLNLTGSAGLAASAASAGALPSAVVNVIWMGIGVVSLTTAFSAPRTIRRSGSRRAASPDHHTG